MKKYYFTLLCCCQFIYGAKIADVIDIVANHFKSIGNTTTITGNVKITKGGDILDADKVVVFTDANSGGRESLCSYIQPRSPCKGQTEPSGSHAHLSVWRVYERGKWHRLHNP